VDCGGLAELLDPEDLHLARESVYEFADAAARDHFVAEQSRRAM
jgi:hypothetical protein